MARHLGMMQGLSPVPSLARISSPVRLLSLALPLQNVFGFPLQSPGFFERPDRVEPYKVWQLCLTTVLVSKTGRWHWTADPECLP